MTDPVIADDLYSAERTALFRQHSARLVKFAVTVMLAFVMALAVTIAGDLSDLMLPLIIAVAVFGGVVLGLLVLRHRRDLRDLDSRYGHH